jgi:enoyl-CoA hydratase/carnithine racemase
MSVAVEFDNHRAVLTLRRPDVLNAMNLDVFDGLAGAADEIAAASDVRCVLVTGEGRSFSSGIDTSTFGEVQGAPAEMIARAQSGFRKIGALQVPTIAAIKGHALGAGLQLALACDLRVVADDAQLGLLEAKYGLVPDLGGTQRLPPLVGPGRAKKMIWLAERIDGTQAGRIGLAEIVVPASDVDATAADLAARIEAAPPLVVREVKRLVTLAGTISDDRGMDEEAVSQSTMLTSSDFGEAISAFVERRTAVFTGK